MKTIRQILDGAPLAAPLPETLAEAPVAGLEYDSRRVKPGALFFAFLGAKLDARRFAPQALANGAIAVVCDAPPVEPFDGPWIQVRHGRQARWRSPESPARTERQPPPI